MRCIGCNHGTTAEKSAEGRADLKIEIESHAALIVPIEKELVS